MPIDAPTKPLIRTTKIQALTADVEQPVARRHAERAQGTALMKPVSQASHFHSST